jgi:hypothetical protein
MRRSKIVRFLIFVFAVGALTALGLNKEARANFPPAPGEVVTVADFYQDPDTGYFENPEYGDSTLSGSVFISDLGRATIWEVDPFTGTKTVHVELPAYPELGCGLAGNAGMWTNPITEVIYVNVNSCDPASHGVWKVYPDGALELLAVFPQVTPGSVEMLGQPLPFLINGLVKMGNYLYVVNSFSLGGNLYRVPVAGGTPEVFVSHPYLAFDPMLPPPPGASMMPGGNGLQKYGTSLLYANSGKDIIAEIEVEFGWSWTEGVTQTAGDVSLYCHVEGPDDFALDVFGNVYVTNDVYNQLLKVEPGNTDVDDVEILMDESDGLDGSTSAFFGRFPYSNVLYVTSGSFGNLGMQNARGTPKLQAIGTWTIGYPLR